MSDFLLRIIHKCRTIALTSLILMMGLCCGGCMGLFTGDPHRHAYVTRMGDVDAMGRWTIAQLEGQKIYDGLRALSERIGSTKNDAEAERAISWFVKIISKLEDRPENDIIGTVSGKSLTTRTFLRAIFLDTSFDAYYSPRVEVLLTRLRPDEDHERWRGEWEDAVANLRRNRQLAK